MKKDDSWLCDFCGTDATETMVFTSGVCQAICKHCVNVARRILEVQRRLPKLEEIGPTFP